MSIMVLSRDVHPRRAFLSGPSKATPSARHGILEGFLRRISAALERRRQRRIEQEAGRFITERGGRVTDDLERQLTEHFSGHDFPPYAPPRSLRPFTLRS
jgi:hypothetical protein